MNKRRNRNRRGAVIILTAVCLVAIFAFAAFTVDVGYITLARTQMQASADAAALAAASELIDGADAVRDAAEAVARENLVGQSPTHLVPEEDVELGNWDPGERVFTPLEGAAEDDADSVRVTVKLDATRENALPLLFAPVIGHREAGIEVQAIASIGYPKPRDIMLVLDCSGSMDDFNRMVYTRQAALILADELGQHDRLGLTIYSYPELVDTGIPDWYEDLSPFMKQLLYNYMMSVRFEERLTGFLERNLSFDLDPVKGRIPQLYPAMYADYTNIGGGMRVGIEELLANDRADQTFEVEKILVLMTDGHANRTEPPADDPESSIEYYADMAADAGIIIHGITLGHDAAQTPIRDAAEVTGGEYYHVPDGNFNGLFEVYKAIGRGDEHPRLVN